MSGPKLVPKTKLKAVKLHLEPDLPELMDDAAQFHTEVFKEMGAEERVSRNDVANAFLRWALDSYWAEKGGHPTSPRDRAEKAKSFAAILKKSLPK